MITIAYINCRIDRQGMGLLQNTLFGGLTVNLTNIRNNAVLLGAGNYCPGISFFRHSCAFSRVQVVLQRIEAEYTLARAKQERQARRTGRKRKKKYHCIQDIKG